jgi:methionyl-tRNA formyltransferase
MRPSVIFFGTGDFAVGPLQALIERPDEYKMLAVVTQPDRPMGRNGKMHTPATALLARRNGLTLFQPESLKDIEFLSNVSKLAPDLFVVASYGKIIPATLLRVPKFGALNLHGSLLPKYRGASPIQSAVLEGERETGVTLMLMDAEMDHGPTLAEVRVPINAADTYPTVEGNLSEAAAELLIESVPDFIAGRLKPAEQDHRLATYTKLIKREDGKADWSKETAERLNRKILAYHPWPGLYAIWNRGGKTLRLKITKARVIPDADGKPPGTAFKSPRGNPAVVAAEGALAILEIQPEGKKSMSGKAFLNGYEDFVEATLN